MQLLMIHTPNFISIPNTSNISVTSNVGIPGVWMFQGNTIPFTLLDHISKSTHTVHSYTYTATKAES